MHAAVRRTCSPHANGDERWSLRRAKCSRMILFAASRQCDLPITRRNSKVIWTAIANSHFAGAHPQLGLLVQSCRASASDAAGAPIREGEHWHLTAPSLDTPGLCHHDHLLCSAESAALYGSGVFAYCRGHAAPKELPAEELQLHSWTVREPGGGKPATWRWWRFWQDERHMRAHRDARGGRETAGQRNVPEASTESKSASQVQVATYTHRESKVRDLQKQKSDQSEKGPVCRLPGPGAHFSEALWWHRCARSAGAHIGKTTQRTPQPESFGNKIPPGPCAVCVHGVAVHQPRHATRLWAESEGGESHVGERWGGRIQPLRVCARIESGFRKERLFAVFSEQLDNIYGQFGVLCSSVERRCHR